MFTPYFMSLPFFSSFERFTNHSLFLFPPFPLLQTSGPAVKK